MRVASDIGGTLIYLDEAIQPALASNGNAVSASQP